MVTELSGARQPEFCAQDGFAYRFDWGLDGLAAVAPHADVVIIVDILRFSSAVCAALEAGAVILPYQWAAEDAVAYASSRHAGLAGHRELGQVSLSPCDLLRLEPGTRLVLPSPNGSTLSLAASSMGVGAVIAGCLRNASAVAACAKRLAGPQGVIAVIAAGERWRGADGPLRPAVEDFIGAGAILAALDPSGAVSNPCASPEAAAARAAFLAARPRLADVLLSCASGRELVTRGWADDVHVCAALDVATAVPFLHDDEFRPYGTPVSGA